MQGLRSARKRSLLSANEHFEHERNAADAREMESNNEKNNFKTPYHGADARLAKCEKAEFAQRK